VVAHTLNGSYSIARWLIWGYLQIWGWLIFFCASCVAFGQLLLVRVLRLRNLPALESAVLGMMAGVLAFVMAMYGAGAIGLFDWFFSVALPGVFLAAGLSHGITLGRRLLSELFVAPFTLLSALAGGAGVLFLTMTYLGILSPDALGYDAVWFHVKIAQDYARWKGIAPFPGDYSHALPHLASILYTWGFLVPGLHTAQRWIFALHMEFCILVFTLAGISAAVQRQIGPRPARSGWAAFFLFPGFFVYGLWGTADHIAAFFSIGMALALVHVFESPAPASFALLAFGIAGGLLTKYQAVYVAAPALVLAAIGWSLGWWRLARARRRAVPAESADGSFEADPSPRLVSRRDLWRGPIVLVALGGLLVAPHFLKNIVFYHNPVYPFAQQIFTHSTPTVPDGWLYFEHGMKPQSQNPPGFGDKITNAIRLLRTVSLLPRSAAPAVCSLFVLLIPAATLGGRRRATVVVCALGLGSLVMWALLLVDSRHLETFAPVLAAALAALIVKIWRLGLAARIGLAPLLVLQVAWAADAPFTDHSRAAMDSGIRLIHAGIEGRGSSVLDDYRAGYVALGRAVPLNAKLVIHTFGLSLGIDRDIVMDSIGFQGLISYRQIHTPRELYDRFRALGITHLVHEPNGIYASPTKQEDVLFHSLVSRYGVPMGRFDGLFLTAMPSSPPPVEAPYRVLVVDVPGYADGLYRIEELSDWVVRAPDRKGPEAPDRPATTDNQVELLQSADAVLCSPARSLDPCALSVLDQRFKPIDNRISPWLLYLKI
jgi:hypothetical protein